MTSKGYPHPNEPGNYTHPQPPPAYEQGFAQPSSGNHTYQPVVTQQPVQGMSMLILVDYANLVFVLCIVHITY